MSREVIYGTEDTCEVKVSCFHHQLEDDYLCWYNVSIGHSRLFNPSLITVLAQRELDFWFVWEISGVRLEFRTFGINFNNGTSILLTHYLKTFSTLRSDTNRSRWTTTTKYRAPHKPLLLLAVIKLIVQGIIKTNFIEFTPDLGELFNIFNCIIPLTRFTNMLTLQA